MEEDPRKTGLKNGLRQLSLEGLKRVILFAAKNMLVLDTYNYHEGKYCPLAIGTFIDRGMKHPTNEEVTKALLGLGFKIFNTRGIAGNFYTNNRREDLIQATAEVMAERLGTTSQSIQIKIYKTGGELDQCLTIELPDFSKKTGTMLS